MFFKIIFLLIILFLFFRNKNIESFSGCLPRYYNEHVEIEINDGNNTKQSGILRHSNDDEIILEPATSPIPLESINNIKLNSSCESETRKNYLYSLEQSGLDIGQINPCDITNDNYEKIKNFKLNDWSSNEYSDQNNYCKTNNSITCNMNIYDFQCNQNTNYHRNQYSRRGNIDFCDNLYDNVDNNFECNDLEHDYWNNYLNNGTRTKCGCINRNTFRDLNDEDKINKIKEGIEQQMKKNCNALGDRCKGFRYNIRNLETKLEDFTNDHLNDHNDGSFIPSDNRIYYDSFYYKDCQLNHHINYHTENTELTTFVKKNLELENDYMCEDN